VFAAAVILDPSRPIRGLCDSKILEADEREELAGQIKRRCIAWSVGGADAFEIDQINIYQASRLAMRRAVESLSTRPDYLLIDALRIDFPAEQQPIIHGDARCRAIAAASIIAKVHRDACLARWHDVFPEYNLQSNKGYSTPDHKRALRQFGPTTLHRFSFAPVRDNCPKTYWIGYMNGASPITPEQAELFAESTEAEVEALPEIAVGMTH
jgi:ribonuclease HII